MRISLAGGGTDVPPFSYVYGGAVLNIAISKYAYATIRPMEKGIRLRASTYTGALNFESMETFNSVQNNDVLTATMKDYLGRDGIDASLFLGALPRSGLGSSAAAFVSLIAAINDAGGLGISRRSIAEEAYRLEREKLKNLGGRQDQYASVFGGVSFLDFTGHGEMPNVNRVPIGHKVLMELESRILLFHTGPRLQASGDILESQIKSVVEKNGQVISALENSATLAKRMKDHLLDGDLNRVGELLNSAWSLKKEFSNKISNEAVDDLYSSLLDTGILGGKLCGAGGGGYAFVICKEDRVLDVFEQLQKGGMAPQFITVDMEGVKTWTTRNLETSQSAEPLLPRP